MLDVEAPWRQVPVQEEQGEAERAEAQGLASQGEI